MRVRDRTWMDVEAWLRRDDRAALPLGSTEQHGYLSLATDTVLAERVAVEAAEPLGVPVFPAVPYGRAPYFMAYPGTVSLREETYAALVREVLESLAAHGFGRILVVNGHGGNSEVRPPLESWAARAGVRVRFHDWWRAPRTRAKVVALDPVASHASWMEAFPWNRVEGARPPEVPKLPVDLPDREGLTPDQVRDRLGDGSFGGRYVRPDDEMHSLWEVAVRETRELLEDPWE